MSNRICPQKATGCRKPWRGNGFGDSLSPMAHMGKTLRRIRVDAGLSASELARRAGMTEGSVRRLEQLQVSNLRGNNLVKVLAALGLSFDEFARMLAAEWDGSLAAWQRYQLISVARQLRNHDLTMAHSAMMEAARRAGTPVPDHVGRAGPIAGEPAAPPNHNTVRLVHPPIARVGYVEQVIEHITAPPPPASKGRAKMKPSPSHKRKRRHA